MMQIFRAASIAATAALTLLVASCSKDSTSDTPKPDTTPTPVEIVINEYTPTAVTATFTPTDPNIVYYPHVIRKVAFQKDWGGDVVRYMASYINHLCESNPNYSREEILTDLILTRGEYRFYEERLIPDTDYLLFAVAVNNEGVPVKAMVTKEFRTGKVAIQDCTFDIEVSDISLTRAKFAFTPSKKDLEYIRGIVYAAQYPLDKPTQAEFAQLLAEELIEQAAAYHAVGYLDAIPRISIKGDKEQDLEIGSLQPNVEYMIVTMGIDPSGIINTAPTAQIFKTKPANTSDITFSAQIDKSAVGASVTITPSNNDTYYARIYSTATLGNASDMQVIATLSSQGVSENLLSGVQTIDIWKNSLIPDTDYTLIVYGCDEWATTPVERIAFKTDASGDPSKCTFDFDINFVNVRTNYTVIPSDNTVFFYCQHELTSRHPTNDRTIIEAVNQDIAEMLADDKTGLDSGELMMFLCNRNRTDSTFVCLPKTSYTVYAVAVDAKTHQVASTKVFRKQFTTPERSISSADITVTDKRYYDFDKLAAYDPEEYGGAYVGGGFVLSKITVAPKNAEAVKWYVDIYGGDITSSAEESVINNLLVHGKPLEGNVRFCESYYKDKSPNTLCYIAVDASGDLGVLHRELWEPVRGGDSPIEELVGGPKGASVRIPFRTAFTETEAASSLSPMRQRYDAAKASGVLTRAAAAQAATASEAAPSTDFVLYEGGDKVGVIR